MLMVRGYCDLARSRSGNWGSSVCSIATTTDNVFRCLTNVKRTDCTFDAQVTQSQPNHHETAISEN